MAHKRVAIWLTIVVILLLLENEKTFAMNSEEKQRLKLKVVEMFKHAYSSYMKHAYPADELMPLTCRGRYRGSEPSRGDVDDSLGNFTLTLVDTLDTLAGSTRKDMALSAISMNSALADKEFVLSLHHKLHILGDIPEFERAVRHVIKDTKFDADVAVSVFETNIRVLGGLLGGHVIATYLKRRKYAMEWYADELLNMAKDIGTRLLPAFNTTTGIPYPRVNLKQGIDLEMNQKNRDTCTACAGTMILEFAALSRLTGDPVFEEKAHKAMDYLWSQRHRSSDLMGTVINIQNGDWIRRESGVGAGIDSYYEYVLKAYILLGDDTYLDRFNKHYDAIMKYVSQGPLFVDVHMHRPHTTSRHFMDSLLAFWPGLQVLKGDIQPAIELHEMLYQVMQKHNFLPEAFTSDFRVHWAQHPLRPEFVESTYFLYKATGDPYYLEVGKVVIENLEAHARVPCGFAALKDVTKGTHEDQMDSFVLAETFKYLFLLYAEKSDLVLDVDDYIFTTEAHLLPLSLSLCNSTRGPPQRLNREMYSHLKEVIEDEVTEDGDHNTCPNPVYKYKQSLNYAQKLRLNLKDYVKSSYPENVGQPLCPTGSKPNRLRAQDFVAGNKQQLIQLKSMGIQLVTMNDGRIQLLHTATEALTPEMAEDGLRFMQEMIELSKSQPQNAQHEPMLIQLLSPPYLGSVVYKAGPAQFGYDLKLKPAITGILQMVEPFKGCTEITNSERLQGKIALLERGECMFVDKARKIEQAGAIGGIVIDHNPGTAGETQPLFAMSGDNNNDVHIPMLFLFHTEGHALIKAWQEHAGLQVMMTDKVMIFGSKPGDDGTDSGTQEAGTEKSGDSKSSQSAQSSQAGSDGPYLERHFEFQPLQQVGENNQFNMKVQKLFEFQTLQAEGEGNQFNVKLESKKLTMDIHITTPKMKPDIPEASTAVTNDGVVRLRTQPDGSKVLVFNLANLKIESSETPAVAEIYEELYKTLLTKTNFNQLDNKADYLTAIIAFLETTYYGDELHNENYANLFDEMANELEIILDEKEEKDQTEEMEVVLHKLSGSGDVTGIHHHTEQSSEELTKKEVVAEGKFDPETEEVKTIHTGGVTMKLHTRPVAGGAESYASEQDFEEAPHHIKKTSEEKDKMVHVGVNDRGLPEESKVRGPEHHEGSVPVRKESNIDTDKENEGNTQTDESIGDSNVGAQRNDFDEPTKHTHSDSIKKPKSTIQVDNPEKHISKDAALDPEQDTLASEESEIKAGKDSHQHSQEDGDTISATRKSHRGHGDL